MKLECKYIIGADEVGYGSLAGPLVVAGVKAPKNWSLDGLNDSKKLSAKKREQMRDRLTKLIINKEISYHLVEFSNTDIDGVGVARVLKRAYIEIFKTLYCVDSHIISDGVLDFSDYGIDHYSMESMVKADTKIPTVMAASILAKTYRDEKMKNLHKLYPKYLWNKNVGYGSKTHLLAIEMWGPTPYHRMSYAPMKNMDLSQFK